MPISKEERAEINRRNAAKSTGPKTVAGKQRSRLNAIKHARYVKAVELMTPPHTAVFFTEDRREFFVILHELRRVFVPMNSVEADIVDEMANTRWAISRARRLEVAIQNRALHHQHTLLTDEQVNSDDNLIDVDIDIRAAESIARNPALIDARRQVRQGHRLLAQLEKRLADLRKNFPNNTHTLPDNDDQIDRDLVVAEIDDKEVEERQDMEGTGVTATEAQAPSKQSHLSVANKQQSAEFNGTRPPEPPGGTRS